MPTNDELFARACDVIPGGVNSPVRAFRSVGGSPYFVQKAEGPYVWDVEGNRYLDLVQSYGAVILGHLHALAVLAAGAQQAVDREHPLEKPAAPLGIEALVLTGGPRKVPGVHEHIGGVEAVDGLVQRNLADVLVHQYPLRGGGVVEQGLHPVAVHRPGPYGVLVDRRPLRQLDAGAGLQEVGKPLDERPHHVSGGPSLARSRVVPGFRARAANAVGEPGGDGAVLVCCATHLVGSL